MSHDQLSKSLITTFFTDFLRLAAPDSSPRLRAGEAVFVDKELFTDWPTGNRRELDLLARVPLEPGELQILVHVEIESEARAGMDRCMWRYYMQIRAKFELPVLPIVVNLRGGPPGVRLEVLAEGFETQVPVAFTFRVLGLSGCQAEEWLARPEPIAWAFAALMRPGKWSRAELKIECLRRVESADVTPWGKEVLSHWIETYVQFSEEDAVEYKRLFEMTKNKRIQKDGADLAGKGRGTGEGSDTPAERGGDAGGLPESSGATLRPCARKGEGEGRSN